MRSNNRAVTLDGINEIFSAIELEIKKHEMGYYYTIFQGKEMQGKTIVAISQSIIKSLVSEKK